MDTNMKTPPGAVALGVSVDGKINSKQVITLVPRKVIPYHRPPLTCRACGQHLHEVKGDTCATCLAWDRLLRGTALTGNALRDVITAGGR